LVPFFAHYLVIVYVICPTSLGDAGSTEKPNPEYSSSPRGLTQPGGRLFLAGIGTFLMILSYFSLTWMMYPTSDSLIPHSSLWKNGMGMSSDSRGSTLVISSSPPLLGRLLLTRACSLAGSLQDRTRNRIAMKQNNVGMLHVIHLITLLSILNGVSVR